MDFPNENPTEMELHLLIHEIPELLKLDKFLEKSRLLLQDKGIHNLYLFQNSLHWSIDEKQNTEFINTPIFLKPCFIEKKKGIQLQYFLSAGPDNWLINPLLRKLVFDNYNIPLPEEIDLVSKDDVLKSLSMIGSIQKSQGIGLFPLRDQVLYEDLLNIDAPNDALNYLFGNEPKADIVLPQRHSFYNYKLITHCDKSQLEAIAACIVYPYVRIEGPPGTGKSQTITNLIGHLVSQNKKVLLISDKKIALAVVYQKLQDSGLETITSLIHDIDMDKKHFFQSLKKTYEQCIIPNVFEIDDAVHKQYELHSKLLENYSDAQLWIHPEIGLAYHSLKTYHNAHIKLDLNFPKPVLWQKDKLYLEPLLFKIYSSIQKESIGDTIISSLNIPAFKLSHFSEENILQLKEKCVYWNTQFHNSIESLMLISKKAILFKEIILANRLDLFDSRGKQAKQLVKLFKKLAIIQTKRASLHSFNQAWKQPLKEIEIESFLEIVTCYEKEKSPALEKSYLDICQFIKLNFVDNTYNIKPTIKSIAKQLESWHSLGKESEIIKSEIKNIHDLDGDDHIIYQLQYIINKLDQGDIIINNIVNGVYNNEFLLSIINSKNDIDNLYESINELFWDGASLELSSTIDKLDEAISHKALLEATAYSLQFFKNVSKEFWNHYCLIKYNDIMAFEIQVMNQAKLYIEYHQPLLKNTKESDIAFSKQIIKNLEPTVQKNNATQIKINTLHQLFSHFQYYNQSMTKYKGIEKENKILVNQTRKILEHEFAKKQKWISIRKLCASIPHSILFQMRPIWLMSPTAVPSVFSDQSDFFDCLIIDESSRVKLPHSLSSIARAKNIIIVGDEKQMPPSHFFQVKSQDINDEGQYESILHKAVARYPGIMLKHHYRSKRKDLISFSNEFIYKNQLEIQTTESGGLKFIFVEDGIYSDGRNEIEANYLVDCLEKNSSLWQNFNIGIVCFSLEQANCIKNIVTKRRKINTQLDQFITLQENKSAAFFIKNLENIQGDERDIILMSVGYGYNTEKKFKQQFGPLNMEGGERRLNVMITRAKEYMYVFSSIHSYDITHEEKEGVTMLKQFLQYAVYAWSGQH